MSNQRHPPRRPRFIRQDRRAAAILIVFWREPKGAFWRDDEGRYSMEWRCSYEYDEWESAPALDKLCEYRAWEHPMACHWYGFDPDTGEPLDDKDKPRGLSRAESQAWYRLDAPKHFRWRGNRIVPVGPEGQMIKIAKRPKI